MTNMTLIAEIRSWVSAYERGLITRDEMALEISQALLDVARSVND